MTNLLRQKSVLMVGRRFSNNRLVWEQIYKTSEELEEDYVRDLLRDVKFHIINSKVKPRSARKFLHGKLLYDEISIIKKASECKVFCLFTEEQKIFKREKDAFSSVINRGGVYSAKRLFQEFLETTEKEDDEDRSALSLDEALDLIDDYHQLRRMRLNELGYLISLIDRSTEFHSDLLEKIYLVVYEAMMGLEYAEETFGGSRPTDPDEFLDGGFIVAKRYLQTGNFHLALELFKIIIPNAISNNRDVLEASCHLSIAEIYRDYFDSIDETIIESLKGIGDNTYEKLSQENKEILHSMLGQSYFKINETDKAERELKKAIDVSGENDFIAVKWIAQAFYYLGEIYERKLLLHDSSRFYHTASNLMFSVGDIVESDKYRYRSAGTEIKAAYLMVHGALNYHMENNEADALFKAWEALRTMIYAYIHADRNRIFEFEDNTRVILDFVETIVYVPGKIRKTRKLMNTIRKTLDEMQAGLMKPETEIDILEELVEDIEKFIPMPPVTFMLMVADGRLVLMGEIYDTGWKISPIRGVILSGVLSAIMTLMTETSESKDTQLKTVDAGNFKIMLENNENIITALLVDRDIPILRKRLQELQKFAEQEYNERLSNWDGHTAGFEGMIGKTESTLAPTQMVQEMSFY